MVNYIPWRLVKSRTCFMCGSCCTRYAIAFTWEEHRRIGRFWPDKVRVKNRKPYLGRRVDGRCDFLYGKGCYLQIVNMKPFSCKIWPFRVLLKPDRVDRSFHGLCQINNRERFVYLNPACSGINKGNPLDLSETLREVIELSIDSKRQQRYSTAKQLDFNRLISSPRTKRIWDQVLVRGKLHLDPALRDQRQRESTRLYAFERPEGASIGLCLY